ncbi:hypothetical protein M9411_09725 [Pasteurella multocida]|uniref:hypothetical protein n=1 Tax=Pasteurella multocida TaxID=747 RepID=UPI0020259703|nr:hypothetical protein [Pasteurella multocida]URJ84954.1 hypothetical protein M9411_09725 [Pasteurella multocida]
MKKMILLLILIPFALSLSAKEYTPAELNQMVNSGNYPAQGPSTSDSSPMDFGNCVTTAKTMMNAIADNYPVSVITNTSIVYMVKAWVNDAAMTITCSKPDGKMVITQSPYK